jgi:hypothetical protein
MQAQGPWFWIEGIIDIFFYVDLVLNFFTAYEVRWQAKQVEGVRAIASEGASIEPSFACQQQNEIALQLSVAPPPFQHMQHPATSEVITDHKRIARRYLTSWFWIDLLATFPSDYIVKGLEVSTMPHC